jgi:hypothetical protein
MNDKALNAETLRRRAGAQENRGVAHATKSAVPASRRSKAAPLKGGSTRSKSSLSPLVAIHSKNGWG